MLVLTKVLILVWVEYGLGAWEQICIDLIRLSLNPCLGGIWSWSLKNRVEKCERQLIVLILVWVEYGLGVPRTAFLDP